jgi:ferritin
MLSTTLQDGINKQIQHEIQSAYLYLAMSSYCESINLPGFARWLRVQWDEELQHSLKLYDYVYARGGRVVLEAIEKPPVEYGTPMKIFQQVLAHEEKVTALINQLYGQAQKENDYATQIELQWFVKEQVEEEKNAAEIIEQLKMIGEGGPSLIMMDRHLGSRGGK